MREMVICAINLETIIRQNKTLLDSARKKLGPGLYSYSCVFSDSRDQLEIRVIREVADVT